MPEALSAAGLSFWSDVTFGMLLAVPLSSRRNSSPGMQRSMQHGGARLCKAQPRLEQT